MRTLPPLNGIRAFEAAARHQSFSRAGEELHVTPAAVSQQVKGLEEWLGLKLFQRLPRGLVLTAAGRAYMPRLTEVLDRLETATEEVKGADESGILNVSATPGFASMWLAPRVWSFASQHQDLDVRIATSARPPDFSAGNLDLAIRYGRGRYKGFTSELLLQDGMTPVCSPRLLEGPQPLKSPEDLKHHTLLHNETAVLAGFHSSWQDWFEAAGVEGMEGHRGIHFSDYHLVMQETIAARGVALGHIALTGEDLQSGRLVRLFDTVLDSGGDYYVVYPPGAETVPKITAFLSWLRDEVAQCASGQQALVANRVSLRTR
ncbi:hypothetical protein CAI21_05525 [Alkalilimnicola ehrlichii]|uniref:HTH lysR-type domain-containing protein n=1 Tax=Alkalilimnicola ehrlichii TaxID=351052 RepID=A0A3E0X1L9_9GAMM|nr:transcriptional regulator GcvA [Alkalilimnicola ehrlichii]RFA30507.1 hypothetical protein CAI21_05525 [Alkalilimnicola ehrlichii]RFA38057.1 hypothetical protein CAL65_06895 [Alkalilimnicola ehrlichii]